MHIHHSTQRLIQALQHSIERSEKPVATIGNFDGVHKGHISLISQCVATAHKMGHPSVLITFDPHPANILPGKPPHLALGTLAQRMELIQALEVDHALIVPFSPALAAMTALDFGKRFLQPLNLELLFAGYDFCMGSDRLGPDHLLELGQKLDFLVRRIPALLYPIQEEEKTWMQQHQAAVGQKLPLSSSRVRSALSAGEMEIAAAMLGRPYSMRGEVVHGAGRGGPLLGFPTANLDSEGLLPPHPGIYASMVLLPGSSSPLPSVTNVGKNPTFQGQKLSVETHILDFTADLYHQTIEVQLVKRIRGEKTFTGPDELKAQIQADTQKRRELLG